MEQDLHKELNQMNETILNCLQQFSKFREKHVIGEELCYNLHSLIKCIDEYLKSDLVTIQTNNESSKTSICDKYNQLSTSEQSTSSHGQTVKDFAQNGDIYYVFESHGVLPKMKSCVRCDICQKQLQRDYSVYRQHFEFSHSIFEKDEINKHTKICISWLFNCTLCHQDIGYDDCIVHHISKVIHMNNFKSVQRKLSNEFKPPYSKFGYILKKDKVFACKICNTDVSEQLILKHLFLDSQHLKKIIEIYQNQVVKPPGPKSEILFPIEEMKQLCNNKFDKFVLDEHKILRNCSLCDINQIFNRHCIFQRNPNLYYCESCSMDVGLQKNILKHAAKIHHLYRLYKMKLSGKQKMSINSNIKPNNTSNSTINTKIVENQIVQLKISKNEVSENQNQCNGQLKFSGKNDQQKSEINSDKLLQLNENEKPTVPVIIPIKQGIKKFLNEKIPVSERIRNCNEFSLFSNILENILRDIFPKIKTFIYGPQLYGLGCFHDNIMIFVDTGTSYLDPCLNYTVLHKEKVKTVAQYLKEKSTSFWKEITILENPLRIKTGFKDHICDYVLTFDNGMEHFKTNLIIYLFDIQPICQQLCTALTQIMIDSELNDSFGTYAVVLMVIFYLQTNNYLPSIRYLQTQENFSIKIGPWPIEFKHLSRDELKQEKLTDDDFYNVFKDLLQFYTNVMDYDNEIICPYLGQQVQKTYLETPSKEFENLQKFYEINNDADKKLSTFCAMCIQDLIELNLNITKNVTPFLLDEFIMSLQQILEKIT